jgi:hypothetical protein
MSKGRGALFKHIDHKDFKGLKAEAYKWFFQGFNVVPIVFESENNGKIKKKPLCKEWTPWQTHRQTLEEFEAFDWNKAEGFAIICSHPNIEGLYLAVVDYDIKGNLTEEAKSKGKELLKLFPPTRVEKTISGGLHLVYLTKAKPERVTKFRDIYALELIGGDMLCVMAPSRGYELLSGCTPTVVEDITEVFHKILHSEDSALGKPHIDTPLEGKLGLTSEGWIIIYNGKKAILFDDVFSIESNTELAKQLGIPPQEAWRLKTKLLESWSPTLHEIRCLFPMIVGEDKNIMMATLALFTLKLKNPKERIMGILLEGPNSVGKDHFSANMLAPLRDLVIDFSRITGAFAERYFAKNKINGKILFLPEVSSIPYQIHISMSEGRLHIGYVDKKTLEPVEIQAEGYPFVWSTSVEWHGTQDFIHRSVRICLDESIEQTRKITEFDTKMSSDYEFQKRVQKFSDGCIKVFRKLWDESPTNCIVIIPFLETIHKELTKTENLAVKFRRDYKKLIALIKGATILNHKKRVKLSVDGDTIIIADFDDFLQVYELMESTLRPTLTNLSEKDQLVLNALRELQNEPSPSTYTVLARKTGIPSSTIRHHIIPKLENLGYISVDRETRPHKIELLKDFSEAKINIEELRLVAEELIRNAVAKLSSLGQTAKREISPIQASIEEKESAGLAINQTANDLSFPDKNNQKSSSVNDWHFGNDTESRVCSQCIHWDALKCSRHPEWIIVSPHSRDAEECNLYKPKGP